MNRGKTALKRGVAVASVAAMAIAGAVLAAPAASAAPTAGDLVRATPVADAAWVGADGALTTSAAIGAQYDVNHATSVAKVLTGNAQFANGIQIAVPQGTAAGAVTVTLANATFVGIPAITTSSLIKLTGTTSLENVAGFSGTHATPAQVVDATSTITASGQALNPAKTALSFNLSAAGAGPTGSGFLVSLSGIKVNVTGTQGDAITATASGIVAGVTTIGYAGTEGLSAASGSVDGTSAAPQAVPDVTASEKVVGAWADPTSLTFNLTTDGTGGTLKFATDPTLTVAGSTATASITTAFAGGVSGVIKLAGTDDTAIESVKLSGLKVSGLPADATKVTLTLGSTAGSADNGAIGGFSFVPDSAAISVDIPVKQPENRIFGANRYATAALLADNFVTQKGSKVNAVILANGLNSKNGADALSANYLSRQFTAPILLTDSSSTLPAETQASLKKILNTGAITIYVMGKTDSVSQAARNQAALIAYGVTGVTSVKVVEVAGNNRYATSAASAEAGTAIGAFPLQTGKPSLNTAFLASGTTNADALAAGAASDNLQIPVLLTSTTALDPAVKTAINDLGIQQVIVLGNTDRVSKAVVDSLAALGVTSTYRIAGADRYATAASLYSFVIGDPTKGPGLGKTLNTTAYLASGNDGWPDALTVGPVAGQTANVSAVLTTGPTSLAPAASAFLTANKAPTITSVWAVGGPDRVSSATLTAAQAAIK